jgi:hypothetical protein
MLARNPLHTIGLGLIRGRYMQYQCVERLTFEGAIYLHCKWALQTLLPSGLKASFALHSSSQLLDLSTFTPQKPLTNPLPNASKQISFGPTLLELIMYS